MKESEILEIFTKAGVILNGHFVLQSGLHSGTYIDKDWIGLYPNVLYKLASYLAMKVSDLIKLKSITAIDAVIAPAIGAITFGQWLAYSLSLLTGREVMSIIAEKNGSDFVLRPKGIKIDALNVLIAEDILTRGESALKVVRLARGEGARVSAVAVLWNRGEVRVSQLGNVPMIFSLLDLTLPTFTKEECERSGPCSKKIPVNLDIGHGQ